ncbi:unnamed protein product [Ascophyllum nodosum]
MLSLVDYISTGNSLLADFVVGLRWVNLWWQPEFARNVTEDRCSAGIESSYMGPMVYLGNLLLVGSILTGVLVVHVVVISAVEALWLTRSRAKNHVAAARRRGVSTEEMEYRISTGRGPSSGSGLLPAWRSLGEISEREAKSGGGEDEGVLAMTTVATDQEVSPLTVCRDKSHSIWLHYPHVELLVLFFAFEGAVSSQVSVIKVASNCDEFLYPALLTLLFYPLLLFVAVWRTIVVRVHPDALLVFKRFISVRGANGIQGFCLRFKSSWRRGSSMFSWADKGQWETVTTSGDLDVIRDGDWFRIGFEPVFVDYTKAGTWFILISLVELAGVACVSVIVDDSVLQLFLLSGIGAIMFAILLRQRPLANSAINAVAMFLAVLNTVSTALLGTSALKWEGTPMEAEVYQAVFILQLTALIVLAIPVYLDLATTVWRTILIKWKKFLSRETEMVETAEETRKSRKYIRSYIRRKWCYALCVMLRHNVFACARDIYNGLRKAYVPSKPIERNRSPSV